MNTRMHHRTEQSGMTLVEILVTIAILGFIATGIYNIFRVHNIMAARQDETTRMQQELLSIMVMMSDDLRMCGYTPNGGTFGFNATGTNATAVFCTSDKNGNGVLNANNTNPEHLGYRFVGNQIQVFEPQTAAWNATSNVFAGLQIRYFNSNATQFVPTAGTIGDIRFVEITATAMASAARANMPIANRTMTTRVYCRNLGI